MSRGLFVLLFLAVAGCLVFGQEEIELRREFRREIAAHPERISRYLENADPEIRRYALYLDFRRRGAESEQTLRRAMSDTDVQVRLTAVMALGKLAEGNPKLQTLMAEIARKDASPEVRKIAVRASWPFYREIKLLSEDPSWDFDIVKIRSWQLPLEGWRFKTDPGTTGHWENYYKAEFDDSGWRKIRIGYWEEQGVRDYNGIAWYRIKFRMPPKMASNAVELSFGAVDESAWVWLNGEYLGCHDIGNAGWNVPFRVDCRKEVKWDAENTLVVRVQDLFAGGGIWKPVTVDILK